MRVHHTIQGRPPPALVPLVEAEKRPVEEVCLFYSIPKKTFYKWHNRDHGYGSSDHRARTPDKKTKLTHEIKVFIESTKRKANYGPLKMKHAVKRAFGIDVSTTVIYRHCKRRQGPDTEAATEAWLACAAYRAAYDPKAWRRRPARHEVCL